MNNLFDRLATTLEPEIQEKYQEYLIEHIDNTKRAFNYIKENIPEIIEMLPENELYTIDFYISNHDSSKYSSEEFDAYARYFNTKQTNEVKKDFDYAWLHHIHNNPHHWQHWILIQDDDDDKVLDMPIQHIIEMFCDHWSFSWKSGNLKEVQKWYNEHKDKIKLSENTRTIYEKILRLVMENLDKNGL